MPSTCEFEFDRRQLIYYGGETINARLKLRTESEKTCRKVYIEFIGKAKVRWSESRTRSSGKSTQTYYVYYTAYETYVENRAIVHGEGRLAPGTYFYTFNITLPEQVPSSCVEEYGHVSYELILGIDRPLRFDNIFRKPITVLQNVNLNLSREYLIPLQGEDIKYVCCWPCRSGPIVSTLIIPFGGYAPGQNIKYKLHVDNRSQGYDMNGIELRFVQTYAFTATSPSRKIRTCNKILAIDAHYDTVLRLSKRIFEGALLIPPAPPTTREQRIIRVTYRIEFYVKTGCCHNDSEILIPIVIGTVPLVQTATNPENIVLLTPTPPTPDTPEGDPPDYSLIKPPSYESATAVENQFIDEDIDARNRVEGFLPEYPMYKNFALPTAPPTLSDSNDLPSTSTGLEPHRNIPDETTALMANSQH